MATISKFEDIDAWQLAREMTKTIYAISNDGAFARDFGLRDQIRRASVSIMSNIAEGFERGGDKEFFQFVSLAKGSSGEVRAQLYVALDAGYIDQQTFSRLSDMATQINRMLAGLMKYLRSSELKGSKYK
ncbi:four helix bundle protein [Pseudomonas aeruginosa]|jgi:four helix bundle protein|uniref:four helix bundle protein n=1 Tax=Pseudomonas aeruginosa TaxID=287 RepID=UPI001A1E24D8|nr:four helix bundle protein [Pseudomonas aeruginosa]MBH9078685.1 four helix bundle protein [Pseudomonas aeruginosa]HBP1057555.1 four helix bundle protein [Pseudomonas aeruginosa]